MAVLGAGTYGATDFAARWPDLVPPIELAAWASISAGAILAFYAFIGFEDMVNVAEEVKDVRRTMPRAITITLIATALLYLALTSVAVLTVPPVELAQSSAPLALVFERSAGISSRPLSAIAIAATLNGALIQIIMASRVLYGLSAQGSLPSLLRRISPVTRTPLIATAVVAALVLLFAFWLPLATLAEATTMITLAIFAMVNLSLWRIKRRDRAPPGVAVVPMAIPQIGFVVSAAFLLVQLFQRLVG